jgi:putative flippase GtrA
MRSIEAEGFRFLVAGGANTVFTYLIYLLLLPRLGFVAAFTVSFLSGIVFAYVIYSRFVFRVPLAWRKLFRYPALYLLQYLLGLALLALLIDTVGLDARLAPMVNVMLLTPLTFALNRRFLSWRPA